MVLKGEDILREIESGGYQVTGGRESIGGGQDGPLRLTGRNIESGQRHTCTGKPNSLPMPAGRIGVSVTT